MFLGGKMLLTALKYKIMHQVDDLFKTRSVLINIKHQIMLIEKGNAFDWLMLSLGNVEVFFSVSTSGHFLDS